MFWIGMFTGIVLGISGTMTCLILGYGWLRKLVKGPQ